MKERSQHYRFGSFELDPNSGELRKSGLRIKLEDQPFRLLAELVAHPGEVLTREELRAGLWPEDTYVEFDRSLTRAVNKVRVALGDNAANPRFIETLPRRGYRFVAPVAPVLAVEALLPQRLQQYSSGAASENPGALEGSGCDRCCRNRNRRGRRTGYTASIAPTHLGSCRSSV